MTVPAQSELFNSSTANGLTSDFPFSFKILSADDIVVMLDGVIQTSGFTLSGIGSDTGGTISFTVAPSNGTVVTRYLDVSLKRDKDYQQFGDWFAAVVNGDFDRIILGMQSLKRQIERAIKLPANTPGDQVFSEDETARAGTVVGFDAVGSLKLLAAQSGTSLTDLAAPTGSAIVGFTQAGTGSVPRTMQDKARDVLTLSDYSSVSSALSYAISSDGVIAVHDSVVIRIPTDCANLQDAVDHTTPYSSGVTITLNIEAGHALVSGLQVANGDYSQYVITSDDATVTLDAAWVAGMPLLKGRNAKMPRWNVFVDCGAHDVGGAGNEPGAIQVIENSSLMLGVGAGATGGAAGNVGLFVYRNSQATGYECVFTNFADANIWVTHASTAYLEDVTATGAGVYGAFVSRGSTMYGSGGDYSGAGTYGAHVLRSRFVGIPTTHATKFNSCGTAGVNAEDTSQVIISYRNFAVQIHDCVTHGITAATGSCVEATNISINTVASDAVRCSTGAVVNVTGGTFAAIGRDVISAGLTQSGGVVIADAITANAAGRYAINAANGGAVFARGASLQNAVTGAIFAVSGGKVVATSANASGSGVNAIYAQAGEVIANSITATGVGSRGVLAIDGSTVNVQGANLSGATTSGIRAEKGSRINACGANAQAGGSPASTDCQVQTGSIISFNAGTGGTNATVNTITASGIIFG